MLAFFEYKDDQYPFNGINHEREIVRAILINKDKKICLEKILDNDAFGSRDYYETPGGGIKEGETHEEALKREIEEEVGYKCEVLAPIADVDDYYNLICRKNHNHFYLVKCKEKTIQHLEEDEKKRLDKIVWVSIDEAIVLYENMQNVLVGKLVKQRELPVLKLAKEMIEKL